MQVRFFDAKHLGVYLDQEGIVTLQMTPAKPVPVYDGFAAMLRDGWPVPVGEASTPWPKAMTTTAAATAATRTLVPRPFTPSVSAVRFADISPASISLLLAQHSTRS